VLGDRRRQYYLGEDTEALRAAMGRQRERWSQGVADTASLEKAVAMALAAGCNGLDHRAYKVLAAIGQSGYFRAGAVLVGSYAFVAAANLLGVRWPREVAMTLDLDLAVSDHAMIAVPSDTTPISDVILNAEQGLLTVPMLDPRLPSTSFKIRGGSFRVDLLTPGKGNPRATQYVGKTGSHAQPLVYLDSLLDDVQQAVLLHKDGVLVNIPSPARLALHKLVVAGQRPATVAGKTRKDRGQAALLLACLLDQRPGDLWLALDAVRDYPVAKLEKMLRSGLTQMKDNALSQPILDYLKR